MARLFILDMPDFSVYLGSYKKLQPREGTSGRKAVKLPLSVRSDYYRGLLVLSKIDRLIDSRERAILVRIGGIFDFDRRFCETTVDELLSNNHITRSPVVFFHEAVKKCFFHDALRLAFSDGFMHPGEIRWLRKVAGVNGLTDEWLDSVIEETQKSNATQCDIPFEIQRLLMNGAN